MEMKDTYVTEIWELTLEKGIRLPAKKISQFFKPVLKRTKFKVKVGKFTIQDSLAAQKLDFKITPGDQASNIRFMVWMANRMIKNVDPYWDKTEDQMMDMFCDDTIIELNKILTASTPDAVKKNSYLLKDKENQ